MTPAAAEIAADPAAVIAGLVAAAVHDLDEGQVRDVVLAVAGGRAKARRIAAALAARPGVLGDGLSPAPRAIADLLIGLRKAGAGAVSAPRCARCRKPLRTFQRRGQDWYCAVCASWPARAPHAARHGGSAHGTGPGGPAAGSARTTEAATRSRSSAH